MRSTPLFIVRARSCARLLLLTLIPLLVLLAAGCADESTPEGTDDTGSLFGTDGLQLPDTANPSDTGGTGTDGVDDAGMADVGGTDGLDGTEDAGGSGVDAVGEDVPPIEEDTGPTCDPSSCDDGQLCTEAVCNEQGECVNQPKDGGDCPFQNGPCGAGVCSGGACVPKDGEPCTWGAGAEGCQAGVCTNGNCGPKDGGACPLGYGDAGCSTGACSGGFCFPDNGAPCNSDSAACPVGECSGGYCFSKEGQPCDSGNDTCPAGICSSGQCFIKEGEPCTATYEVDLCQDVDVAGICATSGDCLVTQPPPEHDCPGCDGICIECFTQICIPFSEGT